MITINKPVTFFLNPVFNRVLLELLSDNAGLDGFRYVLEVRNNITDQLITRAFYDTPFDISQPVEVDVSRFMQGGFEYKKSLGYNYFELSNCNIRQYKFVAKEYINGEHNGQEDILEDVYAWAASFSPYELPFINDTTFVINRFAGEVKRPLTDLRRLKIPRTGDAYFSFIQENNFANPNIEKLLFVEVKSYIGSTLTSTANITNNAVNPSDQYGVLHFRFNPTSLSFLGVDSTADYWVLRMRYQIGTQQYWSDLARIDVMSCSRFSPVKVIWLNRYGVYDCYYFNMLSQDTYKVERKRYKREYNRLGYSELWSSGGSPFGNTKVFDNTMPSYHTKEMQMLRVNTDFLNDAESIVMKQLFSSPSIYIVKDFDDINYPTNQRSIIGNALSFQQSQRERLIPVILEQDTYEVKRNSNQRLFNVEMTFTYCEHSNRQIT